jgi:hypothetical protein
MKLESQLKLVNRLIADAQKELHQHQKRGNSAAAILVEEEIEGLRHIGATLIGVRDLQSGLLKLTGI